MDQTAEVRPGFVLAAVRHRWRTIVIGAVLGVLLGLAALSQLATTYTSQTQLFLNPLVGNPLSPDLGTSRTDQLAALETEAALIATSAVADLAIASSTAKLPDSPEDNLAVSAPSNTQVLDLSYTGSSSAVANAGARAFADAYLAYRTSQAQQYNTERAALITQQLDQTTQLLDDATAQLAGAASGSATEQRLQSQLATYADRLAQLDLDLIDATNALPSPGRVITPASQALTPSGLPAWLVLLAALIAGAGLGAVVALAKEHSDERIRDAGELTAIGAGHPLAEVTIGNGPFPLSRPAPPGYRFLLTGVLARAHESKVTCVLGIDPAGAGEVAAGLAAAAYRQGGPALVLGVDRPPTWDDATIVSVADIVAADGQVLLPPDDGPWLVVVPLDHADDAAEEFILSPALQRFVDEMRSSGAVVCLAGGSSASATGLRLAALADLTLVVVELGRDTFSDVVDVVETLAEAGVEHVGLVVAHR